MTSSVLLFDVAVETDVLYYDHDGVKLRGDLYLPKGKGPFPVVIGVPGGGWRICIRASLREWGFHLAARGFGMFVIDYRVATETSKAFPEAVQDVVSAVRFVSGGASGRPIDPLRIALLGASAGAHLAALAALGGNAIASPGDDRSGASTADVKALIAIYGVYDLFRQWQDDLGRNPDPRWNLTRNLIGKDPFEDPDAYFAASPLRHISYEKNGMPVFVSWGTADDVVDATQSEAFVRALQQARFNVRTHKIPGSHFWFSDSLDDPSSGSSNVAPRLMQFLDCVL